MSNNFDNIDFEGLNKLAEESKKLINAEMAKFETTFSEVRKNLPEDKLAEFDKNKALMNKAIALAKQGKQEEANQIINKLKNER